MMFLQHSVVLKSQAVTKKKMYNYLLLIWQFYSRHIHTVAVVGFTVKFLSPTRKREGQWRLIRPWERNDNAVHTAKVLSVLVSPGMMNGGTQLKPHQW